MSITKYFPALALGAVVTLLAACVSQPATPPVAQPASPAPTAAAAQNPAAKTEKDTAAALEKKFQDAAKGYKVVERDGKTLYCKREKVMGSTIPTMQCMTEAQLRNQVEAMEDARARMRNSNKCTLGAGCGAGS
jgi:hypothetical protein